MLKVLETDEFASRDELHAALAALSGDELVRLKQLARLRSSGLEPLSWEDVLQEAIHRSLDGSRRWPRDVPLLAFLAQTMRSVASSEWRRRRGEKTLSESQLSPTEGALPLDAIAVDDLTPERDLMAKRALEEIEAIFDNDSRALNVIRALALGLSPQDCQHEYGMTAVEYASAQRRIRRELARSSSRSSP